MSLRKLTLCLLLLLTCHNLAEAQGKKTVYSGYNWHGVAAFQLSADFMHEFWVDDLLPFGYKPNGRSNLAIVQQNGISVSKPVNLTDTACFAKVVYFIADSAVYKVQLHPAKRTLKVQEAAIRKVLDSYFGQSDYANAKATVYSDDEFMVKLDHAANTMEITSLDHQPLTETIFDGLNLRAYQQGGDNWFGFAGNQSVSLNFYNQIAKENNVQLAFGVQYQAPLPQLTTITFETSAHQQYTYPLNVQTAGGVAKANRCYMPIAVARKLARSGKVKVTLNGTKPVSYTMPAYQMHSLQSAVQFYKENVSNPLIRYQSR